MTRTYPCVFFADIADYGEYRYCYIYGEMTCIGGQIICSSCFRHSAAFQAYWSINNESNWKFIYSKLSLYGDGSVPSFICHGTSVDS